MRHLLTWLFLALAMLTAAFMVGCGDAESTEPATITSFAPMTGPVGTTVTITGGDFTGATGVLFNGVSLPSSFTVVSATEITAVVPEGAVTSKIAVCFSDSYVLTAEDFIVAGVAAPTITSFDPISGGDNGGTTVTITGNHFTGATAVNFNDVAAAAFTVVSATAITAVTPAGVTTGKISVTTPGGTVDSADDFTALPVAQITACNPTLGGFSGGDAVVITGSHFTGATSVRFGGVEAMSFTVDSDTQMTAVTPPNAPGPCAITVETPNGIGESSNTIFTYSMPI